MRKLIATLLFIFWPGLLLAPGQQSMFFSMNVAPAAATGGGTIARVNGNAFGDLDVVGEAVTQAMGFSTGDGHFLRVVVTGGTPTGVTANPGGIALTQALSFVGTRTTIKIFYLPNTPAGLNSITASYSGSNGNLSTIDYEEYSGMSTTASVVNSFATCPGSYVGSTTWSCGAYTATASNLVLSGCAAAFPHATTYIAGTGWTTTNAWVVAGTSIAEWTQDQLSPAAGSYTGTGTFSAGGGGEYYDCYIGSFE